MPGKEYHYQCPQCQYETRNSFHFKRHVKAVHNQVWNFNCNRCDFKSSLKSALRRHIEAQHDNIIRKFACEKCNYKSSRNASLYDHIKAVHDKIKDIFCKQCEYKTNHNGHLNRHVATRHDTNAELFYEKFNHRAKTQENLQLHIKSSHRETNGWQCGQCNYKAEQQSVLKQHIKYVHEIREFACDKCDYKTSEIANLTHHVNILHEQLPDFNCKECQQCSFRALNMFDLKSHVKAVHNEIRGEGQAIFHNYSNFLNLLNAESMKEDYEVRQSNLHVLTEYHKDQDLINMKSNEESSVTIHVPGKSSKDTHSLSSPLPITKFNPHMVTALLTTIPLMTGDQTSQIQDISHNPGANRIESSGPRQIPREKKNEYKGSTIFDRLDSKEKLRQDMCVKFQCLQCQYATIYSSHFKRHVKAIHEKVWDFICNRCDYKSSQKTDLRRHIDAQHDHIRKFACEKCDYKTSRNTSLRDHIKAVHNKIKDLSCRQCAYKTNYRSHLNRHVATRHDNNSMAELSSPVQYTSHQAEGQRSERSGTGSRQTTTAAKTLSVPHPKLILDIQESTTSEKLPSTAVHDNIKNWKCGQCDYKAKRQYTLKQHIKAVHHKIKDKTCAKCNYTSTYSSHLSTHIKAVHDKKLSYGCKKCNFSTTWKTDLLRHLKALHKTQIQDVQSEINYMSSEKCAKPNSSRTHLEQHKRPEDAKDRDMAHNEESVPVPRPGQQVANEQGKIHGRDLSGRGMCANCGHMFHPNEDVEGHFDSCPKTRNHFRSIGYRFTELPSLEGYSVPGTSDTKLGGHTEFDTKM